MTRQDAYRPADHELAKDAVARGQILALSTVINQLERVAPGRRLSVALRQKGSGWTYDFSVLAPNGVVRRVVIDARSNKVLELRDVP
ncbi:PepSY domain-containing protein [Alsobacter sp. R-9]